MVTVFAGDNTTFHDCVGPLDDVSFIIISLLFIIFLQYYLFISSHSSDIINTTMFQVVKTIQ